MAPRGAGSGEVDRSSRAAPGGVARGAQWACSLADRQLSPSRARGPGGSAWGRGQEARFPPIPNRHYLRWACPRASAPFPVETGQLWPVVHADLRPEGSWAPSRSPQVPARWPPGQGLGSGRVGRDSGQDPGQVVLQTGAGSSPGAGILGAREAGLGRDLPLKLGRNCPPVLLLLSPRQSGPVGPLGAGSVLRAPAQPVDINSFFIHFS